MKKFNKIFLLVIVVVCFLTIFNFKKVFSDEVVNIAGQKNIETAHKTKYNLLAPILGIKCVDTDTLNGDKSCLSGGIGEYLNLIFKILIGLCAALAVIMLIINGITYMGDESVFGKTEAKHKMYSAILGLLIALAAYAILNTINPDLTGGEIKIDQIDIKIEPLYDRGYNDPKKSNGESVRCTPVTTPGSPCTVENLAPIFGAENAVAMSKICNMESGGSSVQSKTDVCKPGDKSFSFGLFQVNLAANGILAGEECVGLFDKKVSGKDALEPKYTSGYSCKLLEGKENVYNKCKNILLDPNKNIAIAKKLFTPDKKAWIGDKKYCASAFK